MQANPVELLSLDGSDCWISHIPELQEKNLIHIPPSAGTPGMCTNMHVLDYVYQRLDHSKHNHIVFHSQGEAFFRLLIDKINILVCLITEDTDLLPEDFSLLCSAMPSQRNTEIFRGLMRYPINLYYVSAWPDSGIRSHHHMLAWSKQCGIKEKSKLLLTYNHSGKPHRLATISNLIAKGLADRCYISACFEPDELDQDAVHDVFCNMEPGLTETLLEHKHLFPIELTIPHSGFEDHDAPLFEIGPLDYTMHRNSYFSVITETQFFNEENNRKHFNVEPSYPCDFATEKTYRTIAAVHPFIVVSSPGFLRGLRDLGYKTFDPYINESYDEIYDDQARLAAIFDEIDRLADFSTDQWNSWLDQVQPILEHNFHTLKNNNNYVVKA